MADSKTRFTPGPWLLEKCGCGNPNCNRYGTSNGVFYQGSGYDPADAHLIAAAPEIYEALQRLLNGMTQHGMADHGPALKAAARAALRKARGEP